MELLGPHRKPAPLALGSVVRRDLAAALGLAGEKVLRRDSFVLLEESPEEGPAAEAGAGTVVQVETFRLPVTDAADPGA